MSELHHRQTHTFGYFVNLNERGSFNADLRDADDNSLMTVSNDESEDGAIALVEDGYMKHGEDLSGLAAYAIQMGIIPAGSSVLPAKDFEAVIDQLHDDWQEALDVLDNYEDNQTIGSLYDDDEELSDSVENLIIDFKIEDHGSLTIGQVKRMANGESAETEQVQASSPRVG
jgi:hypothetical protein